MQRVTDKQYWMHDWLRSNLNTIAYNLQRNFDDIIIVSGSGEVRVGKSVLAQQVGYYLAYKLRTPFGINNVVFSGEELMAFAKSAPPNSVIIYDEARAELDSTRILEQITKSLLNFFAECGALNHQFILVLPDFFELPNGIAINRSSTLINCYKLADKIVKDRDGDEVQEYERGFFDFYNKDEKKTLYEIGKKNYKNYAIGKKYRHFFGHFSDFKVLDDEEYLVKKFAFMKRDKKKVSLDETRFNVALKILNKYISQREIEALLKEEGVKLTQPRINQLMAEIKPIDTLINDK